MEIKEAIKQYRADKIMSQEELCEEIGISIPTLRTIENGNFRNMSTMLKGKVIKFLKNKKIDINNIEDISI